MEEPGRLQSMGSLRVRYDWATSLSPFTFIRCRRKWQPTPVFLPGEAQGWGSLVGCHLWNHTESDTTEVTKQQQQQLNCNEHGDLSSLPGWLSYFYLPEAVFIKFLTLKADISLWGSKEKSKMSNDWIYDYETLSIWVYRFLVTEL